MLLLSLLRCRLRKLVQPAKCQRDNSSLARVSLFACQGIRIELNILVLLDSTTTSTVSLQRLICMYFKLLGYWVFLRKCQLQISYTNLFRKKARDLSLNVVYFDTVQAKQNNKLRYYSCCIIQKNKALRCAKLIGYHQTRSNAHIHVSH